MKKRLFKSRKNRIIGGVCAGFASYFNVDPTIVRCIALVLGLVKGAGLLAYLVLWIIMPYDEAEDIYDDEDLDNNNKIMFACYKYRYKETGLKWVTIYDRNGDAKKKSNTIHSDEEFNDFFKK